MSVDTSTAVVLDWAALLTGDGWSSRSADLLRALVEERDTLTAKVAQLEAWQARRKTAGDLLLDVVGPYVDHMQQCDVEDCQDCIILINRLRLAHKVWFSSRHKGVSLERAALASPAQEPKK